MEIKFDSKELSVLTRAEIAKEISSAEALMALAKDDEIIVRRAVAEINGHVPAGVLNCYWSFKNLKLKLFTLSKFYGFSVKSFFIMCKKHNKNIIS